MRPAPAQQSHLFSGSVRGVIQRGVCDFFWDAEPQMETGNINDKWYKMAKSAVILSFSIWEKTSKSGNIRDIIDIINTRIFQMVLFEP